MEEMSGRKEVSWLRVFQDVAESEWWFSGIGKGIIVCERLSKNNWWEEFQRLVTNTEGMFKFIKQKWKWDDDNNDGLVSYLINLIKKLLISNINFLFPFFDYVDEMMMIFLSPLRYDKIFLSMGVGGHDKAMVWYMEGYYLVRGSKSGRSRKTEVEIKRYIIWIFPSTPIPNIFIRIVRLVYRIVRPHHFSPESTYSSFIPYQIFTWWISTTEFIHLLKQKYKYLVFGSVRGCERVLCELRIE